MFVLLGVGFAQEMQAQVDRKDVRRGNRDFKKESWREAEIDYRKALVKDSLSVAANYNLANTLYREGDFEQARKVMETVKDVAPASASAADYFYNLGDAAIACEDWQAAVDAFKESLLRNPGDLAAKENYIYAKKKLEDQQNQQDQNQDQDQQNDQNQNQNDQQNDQDNPEGGTAGNSGFLVHKSFLSKRDVTDWRTSEAAAGYRGSGHRSLHSRRHR